MRKSTYRGEPKPEEPRDTAAERPDEVSDDDLERVSGGISLITPAVMSARKIARGTK